MNKSGQTMAFDFFISISMFLLVMGMSIVAMNYIDGQLKSNQEEALMRTAAVTASEVLLKTEGSPREWNTTNVKSVGLLSGEFLNESKVIAFVSMDYSPARSTLGIRQYELYVNFTSINSSILNLRGRELSFGSDPIVSSQIIKVQRAALIDSNGTRKTAVINFVVWRRL